MACVHRATLPNFTVNHSFIFVFRKTSNSRLLSSPARFWGKKNKYEKLRQWCSAIINHEWRRTMRNGRSRKSLQMQKTNLYRFTNTHMYLCTYVSCYMPKLQICFFFFIYMRFLHWIWYSLHFLLILFFLYCSLKFYQYQYFMVLYQFLNMWIFIFFIYFVIIFSI